METVFHSQPKKEQTIEKLHDEFLELAVHDLDAPLRKLILLTDRMNEKCTALQLPNDLQPYLTRINSCANDMRTLIDDLHLLTSVRSDNIDFSSCNLDELLQQVLQDLQPHIRETGALIQFASLPVVEGDKRLLSVMFKNLLMNAIKFTRKETKPEISIRSSLLPATQASAMQLSPDIHYHQVEITDKGIGFRKEDAEKIFKPFVSLHGKSAYPGTGMGLAICTRIAELHGGVLYAEGKEKEGANFIFIIPQTLQNPC